MGDSIIAYIVQNLTKNTIILSDLRAEIGPKKMLDLEKIADLQRINRSYDLRSALHTSRLRLVSHSVKRKTESESELPIVKKTIVKEHHHYKQNRDGIDEAKLAAIMTKILQENQPVVQVSNSEDILKAVIDLQKQIANIKDSNNKNTDMPDIDLEHWADLQSAAVKKISQDIEANNTKPGKKVILKSSTKIDDLASELD